MSPDELLTLARRVVDKAGPNEQIEVACSQGRSTSVRVFGGEVESFTSAESAGIGIRVLQDGREGFASAGTFDESVVHQTLADARDNASFAEPDEFAGVATPDGVAAVDIDLWRDELGSFTTEQKIAYAIDLERMVKDKDPRIKGVRSTGYGDSAGAFALASTSGITAASRATSSSISVHALADDGGRVTSGYGFDGAREPGALNLDYVASRAVGRATDLIGATKPSSGPVTLVFGPHETATMLGLIAGTLTGDRILKGRSPFVDRLGEQVASPGLTLVDDPTNPKSLGADSYDGEGLACRRIPLIEDGVLSAYLYDSYNGRKAGLPSTGSAMRGTRGLPSPGVHAMEVFGSGGSLADLIADVENGVLVFSMKGLHSGVNAVSGDFSVGLDGLRIRNGVISGPVSECTAASTLQRLLLNIRTLGSDSTVLPNGAIVPSMLIDDIMLSGDN